MSRQSFSSGEYYNTNEMRKWIASIQIDTEEEVFRSSTGFGYFTEEEELNMLLGARMPKEVDEDYL